MNIKKTLEEIGYLEFKMFMIMDIFHLGGYTVKLGNEYFEMGKQKKVVLMQVVESSVTLTPAKNYITQEKEIFPENTELSEIIEKYGPHIEGATPVNPYLILDNETPIGYIQVYNARYS